MNWFVLFKGILSAYGIALADVVHEAQEACAKTYNEDNFVYFDARLDALKQQCVKQLQEQGFRDSDIGNLLKTVAIML